MNSYNPSSVICVEVSQPALMESTFNLGFGSQMTFSTNCTNCPISSIDEHSLEKPFLLKLILTLSKIGLQLLI